MLQNLSPRFIEELGSPNPQPFAILEIQSKGQSDEATTEAHWTANEAESNVDYDSTPGPPDSGDVILAIDSTFDTSSASRPIGDDTNTGYQGVSDNSDLYKNVDESSFNDSDYNWHGPGLLSPIFYDVSMLAVYTAIPENATLKLVRVYSRATGVDQGLEHVGDHQTGIKVSGSYYYDPVEDVMLDSTYTTYNYEWTVNPDTSAAWLRVELLDIQAIGCQMDISDDGDSVRQSWSYLEVEFYDFETSGSITVQLDLGASAVTSNKATVSIDDNVPIGSGLTYTLEGSDAGTFTGEEINLGSVADGSKVAGYRYYQPTATLTSDGSVTPVLKSIKVEIPDRIYRFTSRRGGIFNALPYLVGIPGRAISIDLKDFVTLGSALNAGLQKDETVDQMLRENYFKNLHASVQIGMYREDITEADLAYTFQGKVAGYSVGMEEVSISLKDGTKDLSAKWPAGISVTKDGTHMVDVINTVLDDVGIASRYINRASLDTLKATVGDGSPASSSYVVYRGGSPPVASGDTTLTEPDTAKKVVGELLELLGAFMVSQEDGKIYVVEYSSSQASVGDPWTSDDFIEDPVYNPDVENIINDTYVYFDWNGEGTDAKDFDNLETSPDNTSITNWGETNTRIIKSKWLAGSAADGYYGEELGIHVGARETLRRKNGMGILPVKTSLAKFETQAGDMVDIDASYLIIDPDVGVGDVIKFMVVNKDPDWENDTISWELVRAR